MYRLTCSLELFDGKLLLREGMRFSRSDVFTELDTVLLHFLDGYVEIPLETFRKHFEVCNETSR